MDRFGADRDRLREDFEQRWLGVQFPGARLRDLEVDLPRDAGGRVGRARVRYSFVASHLAVPVDRPGGTGREMRIAPTFFRSQPGRRFAAEPQRSTSLVLGFDVPTRMTATVELPGAARLDAQGVAGGLVVARAGGYRFVEARDVEPGRPNVIVLRRESTLPIMRVAPDRVRGRGGRPAARRRRRAGRDPHSPRRTGARGGGAMRRRLSAASAAARHAAIAGARLPRIRSASPRRRGTAWSSRGRRTPSAWTRRAPTTSNRWRSPSRSTGGSCDSRPGASSPSPIWPRPGR